MNPISKSRTDLVSKGGGEKQSGQIYIYSGDKNLGNRISQKNGGGS